MWESKEGRVDEKRSWKLWEMAKGGEGLDFKMGIDWHKESDSGPLARNVSFFHESLIFF